MLIFILYPVSTQISLMLFLVAFHSLLSARPLYYHYHDTAGTQLLFGLCYLRTEVKLLVADPDYTHFTVWISCVLWLATSRYVFLLE